MDDLDQKLISALRRDARASLSDLAASLGVARATVRTRVEQLVAKGDILGFTVRLKEDIATMPVRGLMMLGIEGRGTDRIIHQITGRREVQAVHTTNGKWDVIVEIGTDTLEQLDATLSDIRKIDGVVASETSLLLSTRLARR